MKIDMMLVSMGMFTWKCVAIFVNIKKHAQDYINASNYKIVIVIAIRVLLEYALKRRISKMVGIGSGLAPIEEETPRPRVRTPRIQEMDAQEKSDLVFAIDTWIRCNRRNERNHPDGQVARTMRRMERLKEKYETL